MSNEWDILTNNGYKFDPGLTDDHTGFWYRSSWHDSHECYPSMFRHNHGLPQPKDPYELVPESIMALLPAKPPCKVKEHGMKTFRVHAIWNNERTEILYIDAGSHMVEDGELRFYIKSECIARFAPGYWASVRVEWDEIASEQKPLSPEQAGVLELLK